ESIDSAFARFNTIITSLKALDQGYSSKDYVRKFLRALHPKWRAKVTTIKESKDLTSLSLDELIRNLKVYEMIIKKDYKIVKAKGERRYLALKAKKESSDEESSTSESEDKEYAMAVRDFKNFFKRRGRFCFRCGDPNHLIRECAKPPRDKNQRVLIGGSWSDSGEEDDENIKDKTCLVAQKSNEVCFDSSYFSDENSSIDDLALDNEYDKICKMSLKIITKNKRLKAVRNSLENKLSELKGKLSTLEKNKGVDLECTKCQLLKIKNEKLKEKATKLTKFKKNTHCLNEMLSNQKPSEDKLGLGFNSFEASTSGTNEIKFVKSQKETSPSGGPLNKQPPYSRGGPQSNYGTTDSTLVDDDLGKEEAIKVTEKKNLENDIKDETLEIDKIVNIKESRNLPLENVIGNLNQRTLSWIIAMQEELNQFIANGIWELVPQPKNMTIIGTKWVFRNKLDENGVVSRNKARILFAYACALDFKLFQIDVKSAFLNGFINEEVYVAQPPRFIDFEKPNHVYKLKKALYGLKQAPKAWYYRLKAKHEYKMGMVDNTLFTKKKSSNLIIVQIYVDDIIFGSTYQDICDEFAKFMHDKFEMSMMGELNFFLGL
ncbi:copia protein, partial [Tanacetum coccineum]